MGQVSFREAPHLFWAKVDRQWDGDACWQWTGCVSTSGYGRAGKTGYAHRLAYEFAFGAVPEGQEICHRCDNKRCCRPSHLFAGTRSDNMRDAVQKGRHYSPFSAAERQRHGAPASGPFRTQECKP